MTAAMVLSAGLGTRLAPLTEELAKPLMPVGDRPALAHIGAALERAGIATIVVNTHHRAADFQREIGRLAQGLQFLHEPTILGTAGGVAHAAGALGDGAVLIWNGDIVAAELDVRTVLARHEQASAEALWVVELAARGTGTVGLDENGYVVRLRGERFGPETSGGHFLGIQVMGADMRRSLPRQGCLVGDVALPFLRGGGRLASFVYRGPWDDIGQPASLLRANLRWLETRNSSAWAADDARVDPGALLERSLVGEGGGVTGTGTMRECVVFPGARGSAPASRALVGTRATLVVP
jgi:mannose-1-phosphate guanylyltransferase